jgi:hypothetical protein
VGKESLRLDDARRIWWRRYNGSMAKEESEPFAGFGVVPNQRARDGVFILTIYRDGSLTASAHATERGAMLAAVDAIEGELADEEMGGAIDDQFARAQQYLADEGSIMEIIPSPISG